MTVVLGSAFLCTALLHFTAFHVLGLLYPKDRTGVFFVPLAFGAIAASAAVPGGWLRKAQIGALLFVAVLNVAFLRLDQFEEWNFNADSAKVYSTLQCLHTKDQVNHIAAGWPFLGAMNFYRYAGTDPLPEVTDETKAGPEIEAFVLDATWNKPAMDSRALNVIWRSKVTEAMIAVPPAQAARLQGSACF
jgi:hypothetical protein